jgi:hypothetical protein
MFPVKYEHQPSYALNKREDDGVMSRILIVILIYHLHNPVDLIKVYISS